MNTQDAKMLAKAHPVWALFFLLEVVVIAMTVSPLLGLVGGVFVALAMAFFTFLAVCLLSSVWP